MRFDHLMISFSFYYSVKSPIQFLFLKLSFPSFFYPVDCNGRKKHAFTFKVKSNMKSVKKSVRVLHTFKTEASPHVFVYFQVFILATLIKNTILVLNWELKHSKIIKTS